MSLSTPISLTPMSEFTLTYWRPTQLLSLIHPHTIKHMPILLPGEGKLLANKQWVILFQWMSPTTKAETHPLVLLVQLGRLTCLTYVPGRLPTASFLSNTVLCLKTIPDAWQDLWAASASFRDFHAYSKAYSLVLKPFKALVLQASQWTA